MAALDDDGIDVAVVSLQPTLGLELLSPQERAELEQAWLEGIGAVVAASRRTAARVRARACRRRPARRVGRRLRAPRPRRQHGAARRGRGGGCRALRPSRGGRARAGAAGVVELDDRLHLPDAGRVPRVAGRRAGALAVAADRVRHPRGRGGDSARASRAAGGGRPLVARAERVPRRRDVRAARDRALHRDLRCAGSSCTAATAPSSIHAPLLRPSEASAMLSPGLSRSRHRGCCCRDRHRRLASRQGSRRYRSRSTDDGRACRGHRVRGAVLAAVRAPRCRDAVLPAAVPRPERRRLAHLLGQRAEHRLPRSRPLVGRRLRLHRHAARGLVPRRGGRLGARADDRARSGGQVRLRRRRHPRSAPSGCRRIAAHRRSTSTRRRCGGWGTTSPAHAACAAWGSPTRTSCSTSSSAGRAPRGEPKPGPGAPRRSTGPPPDVSGHGMARRCEM